MKKLKKICSIITMITLLISLAPQFTWKAHAASDLAVTPVSNTNSEAAQQLVDTIVGTGVITQNAKFTGATIAAGKFSGGTSSIGFDSGIILSTGHASSIAGANTGEINIMDNDNNTPGDGSSNGSPNLEEIAGNGATHDAAILEFDVKPESSYLSFQYVFSSEEYNKFANSQYNDIFSLYVNEKNQAVLPNTTPAVPVSINNVNGGNPLGTNPKNSQYYINNVDNHLPITMNGLTVAFSVSTVVNAGVWNHVKLAIADVGDARYDSNVFIKANSVTDKAAAPGKFSLPTRHDYVIDVARNDGSDGTSKVTWIAKDSNGNSVGTGTTTFLDGQTTGTITVPSNTKIIQLTNPINGSTVEEGLDDPGIDISKIINLNALTVPDAPTEVKAVAGNGQATVNFTAPSNNGGSPINGYKVQVYDGETLVKTVPSTGIEMSVNIPELANGKAYTFTVKAINAIGDSVESSASNQVIPVGLIEGITVKGTGDINTVKTGETLQMEAAITPDNATNKSVTWTVENGTGSATISETGLLTATKSGIVTVKVTAKDGSGTVGSKDITISSIASSACDVISWKTPSNPVISGTNITKTVDNNTSSLVIDAEVSPNATFKLYSDESCTQEISNKTMNLTLGDNSAYLKVTAEDGTTKTYTIKITREKLTQTTPTFSLAGGPVAFGTEIAISSEGAEHIYYTTDGTDPDTTVGGSTKEYNASSKPVISKPMTIKAIATRENYTNSTIGSASYTQATSLDLSNIVLSGNPKNYIFTANKYDYEGVEVANDVQSIKITPTGLGTITVDGVEVTSGAESNTIELTPGVEKTISVAVTELGKLPRTYLIKVTREKSNSCEVASWKAPSNPVINGTNITKIVDNNISSLVVDAEVSPNATYKLYSDENCTQEISNKTMNLAVGDNSAYLKVTAEDGTAKIYTIKITRATATISPTPQPNKSEQITVDVTDGKSDNTVSKTTVERTTVADGTKKDDVVYEEEKAKDTIDKLKNEGKDTARIVIPDVKDEVSESNVKIPINTLNLLSNGNINLEINTENARVSIPKESLQSLSKASNEDLFFRLVPIKNETEKLKIIERAKKEAIIREATEDSTISIVARPMTIETNMSSRATDITLPLQDVNLPTDSKEKENFLKSLAVFIEHSDGEKELIKGEIVDYKEGLLGVKFRITKFSTFTIIKSDKFLQKSNNCNIVTINSPINSTIKGTDILKTVQYNTSQMKINLTLNNNATWKLYKNKSCTEEITDKNIKLNVGQNKAYLKVTAEDGITTKIYTITIIRSNKTVEPTKPISKKVIFVATKNDFADAYAGSVLAKQLGGKVIVLGKTKSEAQSLVTYVTKNLKKTDTVYILGLQVAVTNDVEKIIKNKGYKNIIRIGGEDKYETAAKISQKLKVKKGTPVVIINGDKMPQNGLNIKKLCESKIYPILFVKKNNLTKYTEAAIKNINPSKIYIVGDKTQISEKAIKQIQNVLKVKSSNIIRIKK